MRPLPFLLILQTVCLAAAPSENPRWKVFGTPISPRSDLNVRWGRQPHSLPPTVSLYRLSPNPFSPEILSNVLNICLFVDTDRRQHSSNQMVLQSKDRSRTLRVSYQAALIDYKTARDDYFPTNVIETVPSDEQAVALAKKLLPRLGIDLEDVAKRDNSSDPNLYVGSSGGMYFPSNRTVNIIKWRSVSFRRAVDGMLISGGDGGTVHFGENGEIYRLSITWHRLDRIESCATIPVDRVVTLLRTGKAYQGLIPGDVPRIDWRSVTSVVINGFSPCYCAGNSDILYPFLVLFTTLDTGAPKVDIEIDCPIIKSDGDP